MMTSFPALDPGHGRGPQTQSRENERGRHEGPEGSSDLDWSHRKTPPSLRQRHPSLHRKRRNAATTHHLASAPRLPLDRTSSQHQRHLPKNHTSSPSPSAFAPGTPSSTSFRGPSGASAPPLLRRPTLSEGLRQQSAELQRLQDSLEEAQRELRAKELALIAKETEVKSRREEARKLREAAQGRSAAQHRVKDLENSLRRSEQELQRVRTTLKLTTGQLQHTQSRLAHRTAQLETQKTHVAASHEARGESLHQEERPSSSAKPVAPPESSARGDTNLVTASIDSGPDTAPASSTIEISAAPGAKNKRGREEPVAESREDKGSGRLLSEQRKVIALEMELQRARGSLVAAEEAYISAQKQSDLCINSLKSQLRQKDDQLKEYFQSVKRQTLAKDVEKKELRIEVRRLQARLNDMESQMGSRLKAVDAEREKTRQSGERADTLLEDLSKAREAERRAHREVDKMASRLSVECAKTASLSEHLNRAIEESKEWEKKHSQLAEEAGSLVQLRSALESAKAEQHAAEIQAEELRDELEVSQASLRAEEERSRKLLEERDASRKAHLEETEMLAQQAESAKSARGALDEDLARTRQNEGELERKLEHMSQAKESLETENQGLAEARASLSKDLAHKEQMLLKLRAELAAANDTRSELKQQLTAQAEQDSRAQEAEKALANAQKELATREESKAALEQELSAYRGKLVAVEQTLESERARFSEALESARKEAHSELDESKRSAVDALERLRDGLESRIRDAEHATTQATQEADAERKRLNEELERVKIEHQSSANALQSRAEAWRAKAENAERAVERMEHDVRLARIELARRTSELDRLTELQQLIERRSEQDTDLKGIIFSVKEQVAAHKALLNLKLLLKSADATDAVTHLEFARVKEKNLEQQLQVLVYNVTACESHMAQCDPVAMQKQQVTRSRRLEKLESQLVDSTSQRNDYLRTSQTNRERLTQLLRQAESRLAQCQRETLDKIPQDLKTMWA